MKKGKMKKFFDNEWWENDWQNMPEFIQKDQSPFKSLIVHFETEEDMNLFAEIVKQKIKKRTLFIYFPKLKKKPYLNKKYIDREDYES